MEVAVNQRMRVVGGLLIAAGLVGIGIYPVRKGLTVRYRPVARRRARRARRNRRRWLLFWW